MQSVNGRLGREGVQESRTRERLSTPEESNFLLKKKTHRERESIPARKKREEKKDTLITVVLFTHLMSI